MEPHLKIDASPRAVHGLAAACTLERNAEATGSRLRITFEPESRAALVRLGTLKIVAHRAIRARSEESQSSADVRECDSKSERESEPAFGYSTVRHRAT